MNTKEIKIKLKEKNMTYEDLSKLSSVPIQTIQKVLAGHTAHPRIDTIEAIEKALGLYRAHIEPIANSTLSDIEKKIISNFNKLDKNRKELVFEILSNLI